MSVPKVFCGIFQIPNTTPLAPKAFCSNQGWSHKWFWEGNGFSRATTDQ
jgi:hypothetical protein